MDVALRLVALIHLTDRLLNGATAQISKGGKKGTAAQQAMAAFLETQHVSPRTTAPAGLSTDPDARPPTRELCP